MFAGTIGLMLNTSAYQAELLGWIMAIPRTNRSARFGMTNFQTVRYVESHKQLDYHSINDQRNYHVDIEFQFAL